MGDSAGGEVGGHTYVTLPNLMSAQPNASCHSCDEALATMASVITVLCTLGIKQLYDYLCSKIKDVEIY